MTIPPRAGVLALPAAYMFYSRYGSRSSRLAWVVGELLPTALMAMFFYHGAPLDLALAYLLARVAFVSLYEIGYLENDTVTIRREPMAQSRLLAPDHRFFDAHLGLVASLKAAVAILATVALAALDHARGAGLDVAAYAVGLALTIGVFALHNTIRSRWNIATVFGLLTLKYGAPLLLVSPAPDELAALSAAATAYPLAGAIEYAAKPRFGLRWAMRLTADIDRFRVGYYALLLLASVSGALLWPGAPIWQLLPAIALYFLAYRLACLWLVRRRGYRRFQRTRAETE